MTRTDNNAVSEKDVLMRAVRTVLLPAALCVAGAFILIALTKERGKLQFLDNLHWTISYGAAAILAWWGAGAAAPEERRPRYWFAWALGAYALGQVIWNVQVLCQWNPFPGPSDLFYLCLGPGITAGLLASLRAKIPANRLRTVLLDIAALSVTVLVLTLALYLPRRGQTPAWPLAVMVFYPMGMLTAACTAIVAVPTLRLRLAWPWVLMLVASCANGVLWIRWNTLTLDNALTDGTVFNALFSVVALVNGVAAMTWRTEQSADPRLERICEGFLRLLPLVVVMGAATAVALAWTVSGSSRGVQLVTAAGAVAVAAMAISRQSLLLDERDRLIEAERRALESRLSFKVLFESAADAVLLSDGAVFTSCNEHTLQMFGRSRDRIIGRSFQEFSPQYQADGMPSAGRIESRLKAALDGEPQAFEWRMLLGDGTEFDAEIRLNRVAAGSGGVFLLAIVHDITARKRAEAALRESEKRFSRVFDASPAIAAISSFPDGRYIDVNRTFTESIGYGRDEVTGRTALELGIWAQPEQRVRIIEAISRGDAVRGVECAIRTKSGKLLTLLTSVERFDMSGKAAVLFVSLDISQHRQLEEQLRQAQKMEAIGILSGGIAHDFNNILGVILGNTQVARLDLPPAHSAHECLDEILKASKRASNLVQQILAFARQQPHSARPLSVQRVVEECRRLLRATLPAAVEIHLRIEGDPPDILADETQLQQILLNLGTNAWHAMHGRPGRITIGVSMATVDAAFAAANPDLATGPHVRLTVADTGCGMDSETLKRIFDPFFTTKAQGEGTGLGLSVVHGIVKRHRGAILVSSTVGTGTTFEILLPAGAAEKRAAPPGSTGPQRGEGQRIFYIDDEQPLVNIATALLGRLGYDVIGFTNPAAALDALRNKECGCDAAITDLNMPAMSGFEFARQAIEIRPGLTVILSTGQVSGDLPAEATEAGIRGVIPKPATLNELASLLHEFLHQNHA